MNFARFFFMSYGVLAVASTLIGQESSPADSLSSKDLSSAFDVEDSGITLHLVPLRSGFFASNFGQDLEKMRSSQTFKTAAQFGIDPVKDLAGYLIVRHRRTGWFYMFHNTVRCDPECHYFVQRIHKRVSDYRSLEGDPNVTDHYLVEAIKSHSGQLKRPDQHYGSYSLRNYKRRVIEKRIEVGEVVLDEADQEPAAWPYQNRLLAVTIQNYNVSRAKYDQIRFRRSVAWTIRVEIDITGKFSLKVPELGIDIVRQVPLLPPVALAADESPEHITLIPGTGMNVLPLGLSEDDVIRIAGAPIRVSTSGTTRHLHYGPGMMLMFGKSKRLDVIHASDGFPGKTSGGIALGDEKQAVVKAHGAPVQGADGFQQFNGLRVEYDEEDKVKTLSVFGKTGEQSEPEKEQL